MDSSKRWGRIRRAVVVSGCVVALGLVPSGALATPGSGVTATVLAKGTSADGLKIKTKGRTDVVVRTVTIAPGGSTGWHYHLGPLIAVVQAGTLTRTLADCTVERSSAGQSFVEPDGARKVHNGRNLGTVPVVLYVTYLVPEGAPLSVDAPDPGCRS
ncbi:cupin domain-containing protein [Streptomyces sp. H10-C2]|uniref:cupin domain-containing protein n=1 Tax=unclassified Streptomyces TaxID=2593676 RepID=UPI0024B93A72|nr:MULTISPECIES: cupin domain-containing protein [unclassified Streptomyces]MDJ0346914.1 cupin domain-containing protein [Streptomyces sp. PH10-H1]MDJ0375245.1 cupin domain-containing protein [Streptomyces sp. H10-C2]